MNADVRVATPMTSVEACIVDCMTVHGVLTHANIERKLYADRKHGRVSPGSATAIGEDGA